MIIVGGTCVDSLVGKIVSLRLCVDNDKFIVGLNKLTEALKAKVPALYQIGDCVKPRKMLQAIREGA